MLKLLFNFLTWTIIKKIKLSKDISCDLSGNI